MKAAIALLAVASASIAMAADSARYRIEEPAALRASVVKSFTLARADGWVHLNATKERATLRRLDADRELSVDEHRCGTQADFAIHSA
jgi:hypothetical protein